MSIDVMATAEHSLHSRDYHSRQLREPGVEGRQRRLHPFQGIQRHSRHQLTNSRDTARAVTSFGDSLCNAIHSECRAPRDLPPSGSKTHPGVKFLKNYGASGQLAKQIESGAPSDLFISANQEWMDDLRHKKLVTDRSIGTFTHNTLVFAGTPGKAASMQNLLKLDRIAIGSPKSVPAGEYAVEALKKAGLGKQLEKKLIMAKDVRECLMFSERGEVDGAFVYRTDALQA